LGHKEFVPSLVLIDSGNLLLSVSGDKSLQTWDFRTGKLVQALELPYVPISIAAVEGFLAIQSSEHLLHIYEFSLLDASKLKVTPLQKKQYASNIEVTSDDKSVFYVEHIDEEKQLLLDKVTCEHKLANFELLCNVKESCVGAELGNFEIYGSYDVSLLFKKKFDNVKQYHDRKKARIEKEAQGKVAKGTKRR